MRGAKLELLIIEEDETNIVYAIADNLHADGLAGRELSVS